MLYIIDHCTRELIMEKVGNYGVIMVYNWTRLAIGVLSVGECESVLKYAEICLVWSVWGPILKHRWVDSAIVPRLQSLILSDLRKPWLSFRCNIKIKGKRLRFRYIIAQIERFPRR